jgi:hypothetical protein
MNIHDIAAMSHDQIEAILRSSAKTLAADPTDTTSRATFFLLNDYAVRKWLSRSLPTSVL